MEQPLTKLYKNKDFSKQLRSADRTAQGCADCNHASSCNGGLRCLSYAVSGDPFKADPGCWLAANHAY